MSNTSPFDTIIRQFEFLSCTRTHLNITAYLSTLQIVDVKLLVMIKKRNILKYRIHNAIYQQNRSIVLVTCIKI